MPFSFLDHTADLEFIASANSLPECLEEAAKALFFAIADTGKVGREERVDFFVKMRGDEVSLLYDFLDKLIFLFDSEQMLLSEFSVTVTKEGLNCTAFGERISEKHEIKALVKSVTYHEMRLWVEGEKTLCKVILDT